MRHPFDGIIVPDSQRIEPERAPTRRMVLRRLLAAAAGVGALLLGSKADASHLTTQALGEEGGFWRPRRRRTPPLYGERPPRVERPGRITTFALGEEGGQPPTQSWREERRRGRLTTFALGEEGGRRFTTQALGEEGGGRY